MELSNERGASGGGARDSTSPRFTTILSARGNDHRPSDLEFGLRAHCQRLMVKGKPLSGAHLLISAERMAIRAYYPCDLEQITLGNEGSDDFDDLSSYFKSFKLALVLFILPIDQPIFQQQLDDSASHFHRAQRLVGDHSMTDTTKNLRVFLLPDTDSAVQSIIMVANSMTAERRHAKKQYFLRLHEKYLLPNPGSGHSSLDATSTSPSISMEYSARASTLVAGAIRKLAGTVGFPKGEEDVLMTMLGNLENIVRANSSTLSAVPIERRTKDILKAFFGSSPDGGGRANDIGHPNLSLGANSHPMSPMREEYQQNPHFGSKNTPPNPVRGEQWIPPAVSPALEVSQNDRQSYMERSHINNNPRVPEPYDQENTVPSGEMWPAIQRPPLPYQRRQLGTLQQQQGHHYHDPSFNERFTGVVATPNHSRQNLEAWSTTSYYSPNTAHMSLSLQGHTYDYRIRRGGDSGGLARFQRQQFHPPTSRQSHPLAELSVYGHGQMPSSRMR